MSNPHHLAGSGDKFVHSCVWLGFSIEQLQQLQSPDDKSTPLDWLICIPKKRIRFLDELGNPMNSPTHANFICLLSYEQTTKARFRDACKTLGSVIGK